MINKSSSDLIHTHANKLSNARILMQVNKLKHFIKSEMNKNLIFKLQLAVAIPVTLCKYKYGDKDYEVDIYGNEKKVYETKYASSCCWSC